MSSALASALASAGFSWLRLASTLVPLAAGLPVPVSVPFTVARVAPVMVPLSVPFMVPVMVPISAWNGCNGLS